MTWHDITQHYIYICIYIYMYISVAAEAHTQTWTCRSQFVCTRTTSIETPRLLRRWDRVTGYARSAHLCVHLCGAPSLSHSSLAGCGNLASNTKLLFSWWLPNRANTNRRARSVTKTSKKHTSDTMQRHVWQHCHSSGIHGIFVMAQFAFFGSHWHSRKPRLPKLCSPRGKYNYNIYIYIYIVVYTIGWKWVSLRSTHFQPIVWESFSSLL